MPPKKSGSSGAEADDSVEKLYRALRRGLQEFNMSIPPKLEEKFSEIRDEKNPGKLTDLVIYDPVGPIGARVIMQSLRQTRYDQTRVIRFWKAQIGDDGVRAICQYMIQFPQVAALELMECDITSLSCEFMAAVLSRDLNHPLAMLKLDHNNIGNEGANNLAQGLNMNSNLQILSLAYCNIDNEGARALLEIIINQNSNIKDLNLQGNCLRNQGICTLFHGLKINKSITKLNLTDNQFGGEDQLVYDKMSEMLASNTTLVELDLRFNGIYDNGAEIIKEMFRAGEDGIRLNTTLTKLLLPENKIAIELIDEINKLISGARKKGKKGKKKGR